MEGLIHDDVPGQQAPGLVNEHLDAEGPLPPDVILGHPYPYTAPNQAAFTPQNHASLPEPVQDDVAFGEVNPRLVQPALAQENMLGLIFGAASGADGGDGPDMGFAQPQPDVPVPNPLPTALVAVTNALHYLQHNNLELAAQPNGPGLVLALHTALSNYNIGHGLLTTAPFVPHVPQENLPPLDGFEHLAGLPGPGPEDFVHWPEVLDNDAAGEPLEVGDIDVNLQDDPGAAQDEDGLEFLAPALGFEPNVNVLPAFGPEPPLPSPPVPNGAAVEEDQAVENVVNMFGPVEAPLLYAAGPAQGENDEANEVVPDMVAAVVDVAGEQALPEVVVQYAQAHIAPEPIAMAIDNIYLPHAEAPAVIQPLDEDAMEGDVAPLQEHRADIDHVVESHRSLGPGGIPQDPSPRGLTGDGAEALSWLCRRSALPEEQQSLNSALIWAARHVRNLDVNHGPEGPQLNDETAIPISGAGILHGRRKKGKKPAIHDGFTNGTKLRTMIGGLTNSWKRLRV